MKAIVEWKTHPETPSEGWHSLWDLYERHFENRVGPSWSDATARVEKSDADENGLLNTASIYIPQVALEHHWHFAAWPFVCEQLTRFNAIDLTALLRPLARLRDSIDEDCAKPSSEPVVFLEAVRDDIHYAAQAKRQQLVLGYSNDTLVSMVRGIKWAEAAQSVSMLSGLPANTVEQVICVLRRELTVGTIEQIDELLTPAIRRLRDAWECFNSNLAPKGDGQKIQGDTCLGEMPHTAATRKRRGRKKADYGTVQKEAKLAAEWVRARAAGILKSAFAKDNGMNQKQLDALLDRVAKRNRRSE
jgi:hypothetical protein